MSQVIKYRLFIANFNALIPEQYTNIRISDTIKDNLWLVYW